MPSPCPCSSIGAANYVYLSPHLPRVGNSIFALFSMIMFTGTLTIQCPVLAESADSAASELRFLDDCTLMLKEKNYDKCIAILKQRLNIDQRQKDLWQLLAVAFYQKGDLKNSEETFRQGISVEPKCVQFWKGLARVLYDQKRLDESKQALAKATAIENEVRVSAIRQEDAAVPVAAEPNDQGRRPSDLLNNNSRYRCVHGLKPVDAGNVDTAATKIGASSKAIDSGF